METYKYVRVEHYARNNGHGKNENENEADYRSMSLAGITNGNFELIHWILE
jgi:hypothetical protein